MAINVHENEKSAGKSIECVCPRCKKKHTKFLFYTGRLPARFHCESCLKIIEKIDAKYA